MAMFEEISADIESYVRNWDRRREDIPQEITDSIIVEILKTGSIDTGRFVASVDFREEGSGGGGYRYLIDSSRDADVTYDGFLEFGTKYFGARENYGGGIRNARIQPIADDIANQSFAR